ncbi:MAG: metallophosphoesterase [Candidatus Diapherotrites archaeon]
MKVVFVADAHSDIAAAERLRDKLLHNHNRAAGKGNVGIKAGNVDLVVVAGDFTKEGSAKVAAEILDALSFARVLAVPGNMDSREVIGLLNEGGVNLHKETVEVGGFVFAGLGGAKPVNTYYRVNTGELEAEKYLAKMLEGCEGKRTVLVAHSPPFGTSLSRTAAGHDLGMRAIRGAIEKFTPLLFVCGHVHEAKGSEMLGETLCINTGALKDGNAVMVELEEGKKPKVEWIGF